MSLTQKPAAREFVSKVYETIDAKNEQGFAKCLTENCTFVYGNNDPVVGRTNAATASQAFLNMLGGIKHHLVDVWAFENVIVSQVAVTYTRKDGSTLTIPAATIWKLQGELIDECRIYADSSLLFDR